MIPQRTLTGSQIFCSPKEILFRNWLPYGLWTCANGRSVLFNRHYEPIWEHINGVTAKCTDHAEWIPWERGGQKWFYSDNNSPWRSQASTNRCISVLKEFGATWEPLTQYISIHYAELRLSKTEDS